MKSINFLILTLVAVTLTACSGGGGGGGGGGTGGGGTGGGATGSATVQLGGTMTYACVGSTISNSTDCSDAGGTWITNGATLSAAGSCNSGGTVLNSSDLDVASCTYGTLTATCSVSGKTFSLAVTASEEAREVCSSLGGTVSVSCPVSNSSDCASVGGTWTAKSPFCSGAYATNTYYGRCSSNGGTMERSLTAVVGSSAIVAGSNVIDMSMDGIWGSTPLNDQSNPPVLAPTIRVDAYMAIERNNTNVWTALIPMTLTVTMDHDPVSQTGSVTATSPIAEVDDGGQDTLKVKTMYMVTPVY